MQAGTPPPAPSLSTPVLPRSTVPPPPLAHLVPPPQPSLPHASTLSPCLADGATPQEVLRRLLREWYAGLAELLLGEAAAADVMGYGEGPHLHACEWTAASSHEMGGAEAADVGGASTDEGCGAGGVLGGPAAALLASVHEGGALLSSMPFPSLNGLHGGTQGDGCSSPADQLIRRLTDLIPSLRADVPSASRRSSSTSPLGDSLFPSQSHLTQPQLPPPQQHHQLNPLEQPPGMHRTLAMPIFEEREEMSSNTNGPPSPSTSMPTAVPHTSVGVLDITTATTATTASTAVSATATVAAAASPQSSTAWSASPWWDAVVDAVNAVMDAFDVVVDTVFSGHPLSPSLPASFSATCALDNDAMAHMFSTTPTAAASAAAEREEEESCIMAGLLLSRNVQVRRGPAYTSVTAPLLVALDLDLTVLRVPLSSIRLRAVPTMPDEELRRLFIDADFICGFCDAVTRRGHKLAICSLTEGTADQHSCGLTVAEAVVTLLSTVLPPTRTYLCSPDDVVCLPKSAAGPGKLLHLQLLQQRCDARETSPSTVATTTVDGGSSGHSYPPAVSLGHSSEPGASLSYSSHEAVEGSGCRHPTAPVLLLPRWLSTDVVLIDDDRENCRLAMTQGYHAAHCADTGLSASWYTARPDVQVLLGVTADDIPRRRFSRGR